MWKAGQLVTIEGKVYRVKKNPVLEPCLVCKDVSTPGYANPCKICIWKLRSNCYLEEIKPRTQARDRS